MNTTMASFQDLKEYFHQIKCEIPRVIILEENLIFDLLKKKKGYQQHNSLNKLAGMDQSLEIFGKVWNQQPSNPRDNSRHQRVKTDQTARYRRAQSSQCPLKCLG